MNFFKSILALKPSTSIESGNENRQQATSFTTTSVTSGNSFIITTTVPTPPSSNQDSEPQQLRIFQTSSPLSPGMAVSPTESFHSATSRTFEQQTQSEKSEKMGRTNAAFTGSTQEMNNGQQQRPYLNNQVAHQEQYWTWKWPFSVFWEEWNNREKIFLIVIVVLSLSVLILISILAVVLTKNMQLREILLEKLGTDFSVI